MPRPIFPGHRPTRAGFALVLVLGFLVLLTILVVAFYSSVTTDYASTKQYSNGAATKGLADSVVQVVMGQIKAATGGTNVTWASQPGMIRTYDTGGNAAGNYKLYSSGAMTTPGALTATQVADYDPVWSTKPAAWTDLNAPVTDIHGYVNFPILDGNNIRLLTTDASGNACPAYYGYDAITNATGATTPDGLPDVAGFAVDPNKVTFNPSAAPSATNTAVPIPVTWLYQLRDGTLIAPDATSTTTATFAKAAVQPNASNPIVARVAFWTDDETSKLNINTACGDEWKPAPISPPPGSVAGTTPYIPPGAFWDVPRAYSAFEYNALALLQPAQHEYQRYPGHPATAYLSAVFSNFTRDQIFSLIPRVSGGGSEGGTVGGPNVSQATLNPDADRLYASVDELLFKPTSTSGTRDLNDTSKSILDKPRLEQAKFFLTADSRAPEVNLFNKPRIAVWPVDQDVVAKQAGGGQSPRGTAFDGLIAFCAHLGPLGNGNDYFFQRSANGYLSQTQDYDLVTGANNTQRNHLLYAYLQSLAGANIPGFGGSLGAKFGADSDQVLTEIFDYVRCTNPSDDNIAFKTTLSAPGVTNGSPTNDSNCYTPGEIFTDNILTGGYFGKILTPKPYHAFITPTRIGATQGFGRTDTVSEVGLAFICSADGSSDTKNPLWTGTPVKGDGGLTGQTEPDQSGTPVVQVYSDFPPIKSPLPTALQIAAHPFFKTAPGYKIPGQYGFDSTNWNRTLPEYDWSADTTGAQWTGVAPGQRRVQSIFLLNPYTVSPGYSNMHMDVGFEVKGLDAISVVGVNGNSAAIGFPQDKTVVMANPTYRTPTFGVNYPFFANSYLAPVRSLPENGASVGDTNQSPSFNDNDVGPVNSASITYPPFRTYEFVSAPFTVNASSMLLSGGQGTTIQVWHLSVPDKAGGISVTPTTSSALAQTISVNLSKLAGNWQVPTLVRTLPGQMGSNARGNSSIAFTNHNPATAWDFSWKGIAGNYYTPGRFFNDVAFRGHDIEPIIMPGDVVKTMVPGYPTDAGSVGGDYRLLAAQNIVDSSVFVPHRWTVDQPGKPMINSFIDLEVNGWAFEAYLIQTDYGQTTGQSARWYGLPESPFGALMTSTVPNAAFSDYTSLVPAQTGDFDNGTGTDMDGPYVNKPDTGYQISSGTYVYPYFGHFAENSSASFFSPNRQVPSPGMFGSLPVGIMSHHPWRTLLFRPQPAHPDGVPVPDAGLTRTGGSPYAGLAADHLIMDWFWMPVVEPYALSEPFSTAGKINMNYQLAPFTYITRATAVDALLKSQRMLATPNMPTAGNWKVPVGYGSDLSGPPTSADFRSDLNLGVTGGTLRQFDETFASGDLFRSATQICDIYLTPQGQSWTTNADAENFWKQHQLTGDNSRERPYANLYGCLTTKSNSFTVHFRVQALQKIPGTAPAQWVEGHDKLLSEYRGSSLIERYVDPQDPSLPDFAAPNAASVALDSFYKFRVVSTKKFSP